MQQIISPRSRTIVPHRAEAAMPHPTTFISVGTLANDPAVLRQNLLQSPDIAQGLVTCDVQWNASSAARGLNGLLRRAEGPVVVLAHQDVFFPRGWFARLADHIGKLEAQGVRWGALGVWGVTWNGEQAGSLYCTGSGGVLHSPLVRQVGICSLDECVLIIDRRAGLAFDEGLPGFHLYGTDLVLEARLKGHDPRVLYEPVVHNSRSWIQLDRGYRRAYRYMQHKWANVLPVRTCIVPITSTGWPLWRRAVLIAVAVLRGRKRRFERLADPGLVIASAFARVPQCPRTS